MKKKLGKVFNEGFESLDEKIIYQAERLGIHFADDGVIENLLEIGDGCNPDNPSEAWEAASWPIRILAIAFTCVAKARSGDGDASDDELIAALCSGNFAIGLVAGMSDDEVKPHLCVPCLLKQHASAIGKNGGNSSHRGTRELKAWTIEKYKEGKGKWKSANQAAHALKDDVIARSQNTSRPLSGSNAQRTIAEWIREHEKESA